MLIVIKGAGDIASGIALRLKHAKFDVVMTDIERPTAIRRTVCFSQAIVNGTAQVEDVKAEKANNAEEIKKILSMGNIAVIADEKARTVCFSQAIVNGTAQVEDVKAEKANNAEEIKKILSMGNIAVIADEKAKIIKALKPEAIVDAILAKENLGTKIDDAPIVIGVGPGFTAGVDCHAVIETKRGHYLGRVIKNGSAAANTGVIDDAPIVIGVGPGFTAGVDCHAVIETKRGHYLGRVIKNGSAAANTGVPGNIGGYTTERIIRAVKDGAFDPVCEIGDTVKEGQTVAYIDGEAVKCSIGGVLRGILPKGTPVYKGMKSGDVDPRCVKEHCYTVSDKALAVGGGVLEAILSFREG